MKNWIIALDLHGTLLNVEWKISQDNQKILAKLIDELTEYADFYICTGNDYSFVKEFVPQALLNKMTGCVLETGCIVKTDDNEINYINEELQTQILELKEYLKSKDYSFVKYFAERRSTISIFTQDSKSGENPVNFYNQINEDILRHPLSERVYLTWSSVALDIIPKGYSKWETLKMLAEDKQIISFMDSYNDKEIAKNSYLTYLPKNASDKLISYLRSENKLVFPLNKFHPTGNQVFISEKPFSEGVIEGLTVFKTITERNLNAKKK